jgi:hypothetical protein
VEVLAVVQDYIQEHSDQLPPKREEENAAKEDAELAKEDAELAKEDADAVNYNQI